MMADAYKPHVSGITNVISLSKQLLEKAGYEVYVFTFGGGDYVEFYYCVQCGQIQGTFPLRKPSVL